MAWEASLADADKLKKLLSVARQLWRDSDRSRTALQLADCGHSYRLMRLKSCEGGVRLSDFASCVELAYSVLMHCKKGVRRFSTSRR